MTVDEAREYLHYMCDLIGTTAVEYWTTKDADKMREAISVLSDGEPIYKKGDQNDS